MVWRDNTLGNYEILLRASNDSGSTFGDVVNLSNNSGDSIVGLRQVEIVASESGVYVVWQDDTPGNLDIFLSRSTDNGKNFSGAVNISNTSGSSNHPEIAVTGNIVYVVWLDDTDHGGLGSNYDVFFSTSIDNGNSFSKATNLSRNGGVGVSPKIAISGSNVYVTWFAGAFPDYEIWVTRSIDNGSTFARPLNLSSNVDLSSNPQIAVSGTNVYVVWQDKTAGNDIAGRWDVFLRTSTDNGATFGNALNLSNNGSSNGPQIAVSGNNVHVTWFDSAPGNEGIFFRSGTLTPN